MFAALTALKIFAGGLFKIDFKTILKWLGVALVAFLLYKAYSGVDDYMTEAETAKAKVVQQSADLKKFKEENDALVKINKQNDDELKRLGESNRVSLTALNDLKDTILANSNKLVVVQKDTKTKIAVIQKKYEAVPVTPETTEAQSTEISLVQIDSIWTVFCDGNDDPLCKAPA